MNREEALTVVVSKMLCEINEATGGIYNVGAYLSFTPGDSTATIDGEFTAEELEAIACYMRTTPEKES